MSLGILAVAMAPVFLVFFQGLGALPPVFCAVVSGACVAVMAAAIWLARSAIRHIGNCGVWFVVSSCLFGIICFLALDVKGTAPYSARIHNSDGMPAADAQMAEARLWGRTGLGFFMHPPYGGPAVPDTLVVEWDDDPESITLLLSKPENALLAADGTPTESDGISLELAALDAGGALLRARTIVIPQGDFLRKLWVRKAIPIEAGTASLKITVGPGAPGSTPDFDSTFVEVHAASVADRVRLVGVAVLAAVAFLNFLLLVHYAGRGWAALFDRHRVSLPVAAGWALLCTIPLLLAWWSQTSTSYVYFYDFRNYWQKTESLYELMNAGNWAQAASAFASQYTAEYSMLPAVIPAALGLLTGYPDRVAYSLLIVAVYALPAYASVMYLVRRLIPDSAASSGRQSNAAWLLAAFTVFVGLPTFFSTTLYLMPDIGGVVLYVFALLCAVELVRAIAGPRGGAPWRGASQALLLSSISLALLLSLMFVFRRWYAFAAFGIVMSLAVLVIFEWLRAGQHRAGVAARAGSAALFSIYTALPLLCWFAFAWLRDGSAHDYGNLYQSYGYSLAEDVESFGAYFGLAAAVLCVVGGIAAYVRGGEKRLFFILAFSTAAACAAFLGVQSPGPHHYYLLMPLLAAFLAALSLLATQRWGWKRSALITIALLAGGGLNQQAPADRGGAVVVAGYRDWLPKQQEHADGLRRLALWLDSPENVEKTFCLIASSRTLNESIFLELWQIDPRLSRSAYHQRLIPMAQVDSRDGPPWPTVRQCRIFLVGTPFQTHLASNQQYSLQLMQRDLVDGVGIGRAVSRPPVVFHLENGVTLQAYETARDISPEEYEDLVTRYWKGK